MNYTPSNGDGADARSSIAAYNDLLNETRDVSRAILDRMEALQAQFPSEDLKQSIRNLRSADV